MPETPLSEDASSSSATASGTSTPIGIEFSAPAGLRQRFKTFADDVSRGVEDLAMKIVPNENGMFKVIAPGTPYDELELSPKETHKRRHSKRVGWKKWLAGRRLLIPAAFVFGAAAVWTATTPDLFQGELADLWPMIQTDMRDFIGNMTLVEAARKTMFETRDFTIGDDLAQEFGLKADHPIILIPGIVSTGLESWSTAAAARNLFRSRLWGTSTMIRSVLTDKSRWVEAIAIDLETGLDPPGHKVRAAQGLDAASEFIQGFWIWQKVVQNLATIGYDTNTMDMAAYDWRLAYYNLEVRDNYLSRLKMRIELMHKKTGKKVVLASHSMGGSLALFFLKWVEAEPDAYGFGGGGGSDWVEKHIEAWANVAGTMLGVPKAMTAFMSGEMRDTVELHPLGSYVLEKFFSRKERAKLFRSWPGASSMWMKGGDRIWGNQTSAPDDEPDSTDSFGRLFSFRPQDIDPEPSEPQHNLTLEEVVPYLLTNTAPEYQRMMESNYSIGFENNPKKLKANARDHRKWSNPLEVQLPNAPSMKIYCLYGYGKETERSYFYAKGEYDQEEGRPEGEDEDAFCKADSNDCERVPLDFPLGREHWINNEVTLKDTVPNVRSGVKFGDGDGTIVTASLGAMCVKGWKGKTKWNPAGIEVVTQEYKHQPENFDLRGGALTADHVDILGSSPLNAALLKIAAGRGDLVEEQLGSKVVEYAERMRWD